MSTIADWIWTPFLSLIYLELGVLFLLVTGGVVLRRAVPIFLVQIRQLGNQRTDGGHIGHTHGFFAGLATSIGVGNMAGVGTAIHLGGPGALFWMWVSALLGMSFRMCSTYMALRYQPSDDKDPVFGTPMVYLQRFFSGRWAFIAPLFAGVIIAKGLVAANLIQSNSVAHAIQEHLGYSSGIVALALSALVALVVISGLNSILNVSMALAPWMAGGYLALALWVLGSHPARTLASFHAVIEHAFTPYTLAGGIAGYSVMQAVQFGIARGIFSHGSGIGLAPFLHAANRDHPVVGAMMAGMIPLVDTILVCTATGLVILSSGLWHEQTGAYLTVSAFQMASGDGARLAVTLCLVVFAFTTIINWSYFSERCFLFLGGRNRVAYRWFFVMVTFCGPFLPVATIWSVGDLLIAALIIIHLLPLTYLLLRYNRTLRHDLNTSIASTEGGGRSLRNDGAPTL
ncbi:alanine/glycine:cation symporter family protein [Magnetofaba australis]|uniref:Amino acid carrier protein n=1 Tax=Magnetofaba australis IT-1 TaxID=1434232 RepID=W0LJC8_9PROT|nr:amino acid carrier protein [Magnetofaba australis]AHG23896.1 amino acid carrier protein [Magnetofaba australis IT-1]OSM08643.1 putative amino acid carrier protein [Magnetofaba australis IT-1]